MREIGLQNMTQSRRDGEEARCTKRNRRRLTRQDDTIRPSRPSLVCGQKAPQSRTIALARPAHAEKSSEDNPRTECATLIDGAPDGRIRALTRSINDLTAGKLRPPFDG